MRKILLLLLSLVGLFDALYLWWEYTSPDRPMVCFGTGCDVVRASPFAYPMGIPMPVPGVAMYAALALLVFAQPLFQAALAGAARKAMAGISGLGFLFSLYLTGVETFVLHAWCFWCMVSAIVVTLIFGLAVLEVVRPLPEPEPAGAIALARRQLAVVVFAVVVGTPLFFVLIRSGKQHTLQPIAPDLRSQYLVRPDSHMTGNPNAALTVVEFGDFQCPACGPAEETARVIRRRYGDRVRFVFRHFPLTRIHAYAQRAAEASECAAEQGKFWEALDRFYKGQDDLSEAALVRYAGEVGVDTSRFRQCLAGPTAAERVNRDAEDARALGLRATPTFFIGTQVVEGPMEVTQFSRLVELELARAGAAPAPAAAATAPPASSSTAAIPTTASPPASAGAASTGALGGGSPFGVQLGGDSAAGCSESEAQKQQATIIHTEEAQREFAAHPRAIFVDVRKAKEFRGARIPGAINVPSDQIAEHEGLLPKDRTLVLYESGRGSGDVCAAGRAAGRMLLERGYAAERVKVYEDGLAGWEKAGMPLER
jgi:protein-disulfide isomerase/rhodanese-related sulfurtransferase